MNLRELYRRAKPVLIPTLTGKSLYIDPEIEAYRVMAMKELLHQHGRVFANTEFPAWATKRDPQGRCYDNAMATVAEWGLIYCEGFYRSRQKASTRRCSPTGGAAPRTEAWLTPPVGKYNTRIPYPISALPFNPCMQPHGKKCTASMVYWTGTLSWGIP